MKSLGMLALGSFIGWITSYGLIHITDWANPGNVLSAVISAAVAGGVFTFIQFLDGKEALRNALFMYPLGLAYGALLNNFAYLRDEVLVLQMLHVASVGLASLLLLGLIFSEPLRRMVCGWDDATGT
jgi:hypothetical protein